MRIPLALLPALLLLACGDKDPEDSGHGHDHEHDDGTDGTSGADGTAGDASRAVTFEARLGGEPFACGEERVVGSSTVSVEDLRLYVNGFSADGAPLDLVDEAPWQGGGVALLDFEDGCRGGTAETRTTVVLSGPAGDWGDLSFEVGVPFDDNHQDVAVAPSPLNVSSMFWNWNGGYKFLKVDGASAGLPTGFSVHLGSTGCEMDDAGAVTGCANGNRVAVSLPGSFDPDNNRVVLDLDALFEGADLDSNTPDTPAVCMSAPTDPDCAPLFENLGLAFGGAAAGTQTLFSVE